MSLVAPDPGYMQVYGVGYGVPADVVRADLLARFPTAQAVLVPDHGADQSHRAQQQNM